MASEPEGKVPEADEFQRIMSELRAGRAGGGLSKREAARLEGELVSLLMPHVRRMARLSLNPELRNVYTSEDIMHSVCIAVIGDLRARGEERFPGDLNAFYGLVKRITVNSVIDKYRKEGRRDEHVSALRAELEARPARIGAGGERQPVLPGPDSRPDPIDLAELNEAARQQLQADEWYLFKLRAVDRLSYLEIARLLSTTEDAARMRYDRLRVALSKKLQKFAKLLRDDCPDAGGPDAPGRHDRPRGVGDADGPAAPATTP